MRWRDRRGWSERPRRPAARKLTATDKDKLSEALGAAIAQSPVLSYFKVEARALRGRFYLDWQRNPEGADAESDTWGRLTPLAEERGALLLEVEYRKGRWSAVAQGSVEEVIDAAACDQRGTFHALGSVEIALRKAGKGLVRLPIKQEEDGRFVYSQSGKRCTVQEVLFHYFGVPLAVVVEPRHWYARHRTPYIVECSGDGHRVLVRFMATGWSGETFGGTCLYLCCEGRWGAYTIKPSESRNIAAAEAWLVKRKWRPW